MALMDRMAGAPISWGVCEVPGWGIELPPDRVLSEMAQLGLAATELGSDGYLPTNPDELKGLVAAHNLEMIGGFVPVVVHDPAEEANTIAAVHQAASLMSPVGGTVFVSSAVTSWDWGPRSPIDAQGWAHASKMFGVIDEIVGEYGMTQALHPHLQTIVETRDDVQAVLDTSDVGWTFDMGHLAIGGTDPLEFLDQAFDRIRHVHLKDVKLDLAAPVFAGEQSIMQGVQAGMFCNLGSGDVPIADIVIELERRGYDQWYVIEQDAAITGDMPEPGSGPILDVQASIEELQAVDQRLAEMGLSPSAASESQASPIGGEE